MCKEEETKPTENSRNTKFFNVTAFWVDKYVHVTRWYATMQLEKQLQITSLMISLYVLEFKRRSFTIKGKIQ